MILRHSASGEPAFELSAHTSTIYAAKPTDRRKGLFFRIDDEPRHPVFNDLGTVPRRIAITGVPEAIPLS